MKHIIGYTQSRRCNERNDTQNRISSLLVLSILSAVFILSLFLSPDAVISQNNSDQGPPGPQERTCKHVPGNECSNASSGTVPDIVQTATDVLTFLVGGISVIVIIIASFMYVTSGGDPNKTKRAKDAILFAVVGILVAVFAQAIVRYVLSAI